LCRAQGVDPKDVEEVILAGGQSGAPLLRVPLEAAFGSKVGREIPAAEAVVNGLAVAGWALRQPERIRRSKPLTKTTLSAGLSVALEGERLAPVLPRGAPLPCETAFRLAVGDSGVLRIAVHQGDSELLGEGQYLGGIRLRAQPNTEVQVTFSLSRQAVLEVSAHAEKTSAFASLATADCTPETRSEIAATALLPVLGGVHEGVNARRLLAR
jgi:molecular chaperone DnaK